jgi:hypothetical protein
MLAIDFVLIAMLIALANFTRLNVTVGARTDKEYTAWYISHVNASRRRWLHPLYGFTLRLVCANLLLWPCWCYLRVDSNTDGPYDTVMAMVLVYDLAPVLRGALLRAWFGASVAVHGLSMFLAVAQVVGGALLCAFITTDASVFTTTRQRILVNAFCWPALCWPLWEMASALMLMGGSANPATIAYVNASRTAAVVVNGDV